MDRDGVETVVEVVEQNTAVVVVMGCLEGCELACAKLRSKLIGLILDPGQTQLGNGDKRVIDPSI